MPSFEIPEVLKKNFRLVGYLHFVEVEPIAMFIALGFTFVVLILLLGIYLMMCKLCCCGMCKPMLTAPEKVNEKSEAGRSLTQEEEENSDVEMNLSDTFVHVTLEE